MQDRNILRENRECVGFHSPSGRSLALIVIPLLLVAAPGLAQNQNPKRNNEPPRRPVEAPRPERQTAAATRHPLDDVMDFASEGRDALKDVKDYTAIFNKTEVVGRKLVKQTMEMKVREKPFSVYFRFRSGPEAGREVIYVAGANNGNALVHETGIKAVAGTVSIRPNGHEVMDENRHPLTEVGISKMLETAYSIWESERKSSDGGQVETKTYPDAELGKTKCKVVEIIHKQQKKELPFSLARVYFDKDTKLPIRAERYGWPRRPGEKPPLVEEYTYTNIRTNVGLKDADFNPRNPAYAFP